MISVHQRLLIVSNLSVYGEILSKKPELSSQNHYLQFLPSPSDKIIFMKINRQLLTISVILLAGLAWIWTSRAVAGETTAGSIPAPRQGFQAPDFSLQNAQGDVVRLSDLRGNPVLVNVWASWCSPCRAEMPAIQRLYQDYQSHGLEILAVNSTTQDSVEKAMAFAQDLGLTFPILFDAEGEVARLHQVQALPSSYFINPDGKIEEVVIGGPMSEALLRVRVEQLLEKP
jgi:cytochrome c biogenesis protein CcmG, thiol:disulfide interchange protein DsbE